MMFGDDQETAVSSGSDEALTTMTQTNKSMRCGGQSDVERRIIMLRLKETQQQNNFTEIMRLTECDVKEKGDL